MDTIQSYLIFLIPVSVGLIAQILKFAIFTLKHGWKPDYIFTHGHMPSAHTALAVSLLTSIGYFDGMNSSAFAVTVGLAFIIIDDALRIRMILGDQGRYLNMLVDQLKGEIDESRFPHLKERVGHRTSEVVAGAIFGFIGTAFLIMLFTN